MEKGRQLTVKEFYDLNKVISKCAEYAIQQTKAAISRCRIYIGSEVSEEEFNLLFDTYRKSIYAQNSTSEYIDYVKTQVRDLLQYEIGCYFENHVLREIMIPVLFFSLIIRHECKPQTVKRRKNKIQEARYSTKVAPKWKRIDLFERIYTDYYMNLPKEKAFSETLAKQRLLVEECHCADNTIISSRFIQAVAQCEKFEGRLHWLNSFGDTARMGTFLYDVLTLQEDGDNILKTIIRLQIINSFQDVLHRCGNIIYKKKPENYNHKIPYSSFILEEYGMCTTNIYRCGFEDICPVPVFYIGNKHNILDELQVSVKEKDKFSVLYNYLLKNFRFDMTDLIDQFLGKAELMPFISCDTNLKDFMSANIKVLGLLKQINTISTDIDNYITVGEFISSDEKRIESAANAHAFPSFEAECEYLSKNGEFDDFDNVEWYNEEDQKPQIPIPDFPSFESEYEHLLKSEEFHDFDDVEWYNEENQKSQIFEERHSDVQPVNIDEAIKQLVDGFRKAGLIE